MYKVNQFPKSVANYICAYLIPLLALHGCNVSSGSFGMQDKEGGVYYNASPSRSDLDGTETHIEMDKMPSSTNRVSKTLEKSSLNSRNTSGSNSACKIVIAFATWAIVSAVATLVPILILKNREVSDLSSQLWNTQNQLSSCENLLYGRVIHGTQNRRMLQNNVTDYYSTGCLDREIGYYDPVNEIHVPGTLSFIFGNESYNNMTWWDGNVSRSITDSGIIGSYEDAQGALWGTNSSNPGCMNLLSTNTSSYPWGTAPKGYKNQTYTLIEELWGNSTYPGCANLLSTNTSNYPSLWGAAPEGYEEQIFDCKSSLSTCTNTSACQQSLNSCIEDLEDGNVLLDSCNDLYNQSQINLTKCETSLSESVRTNEFYIDQTSNCNETLGEAVADLTTCKTQLDTANELLLDCNNRVIDSETNLASYKDLYNDSQANLTRCHTSLDMSANVADELTNTSALLSDCNTRLAAVKALLGV